jgi:hypothetical protein
MGTPDVLAQLSALGVRLHREGDALVAEPRSALTDAARAMIRAHKADLLAVLGQGPLSDPAAEARRQRELFEFTPPGDPANDDEALQERVAIMMEGNGWDAATALQEARWQADRERCWRSFLRNAKRVLEAPPAKREDLLVRYREEAGSRYGERTGTDMAGSLRCWVEARRVH